MRDDVTVPMHMAVATSPAQAVADGLRPQHGSALDRLDSSTLRRNLLYQRQAFWPISASAGIRAAPLLSGRRIVRSHQGGRVCSRTATSEEHAAGAGRSAAPRAVASRADPRMTVEATPARRSRKAATLSPNATSSWRNALVRPPLAASISRPTWRRDIGSRRWLRGVATLIGLSRCRACRLAGLLPAGSRARHAHRRSCARRIPQPDDHAAGAGCRQRPPHGGDARGACRSTRAPERPRLDLVATLAQGDSFDRMLRRAGVGEDEAQLIAALVAAMPCSRRYRAGHAGRHHARPPRRARCAAPARCAVFPRALRPATGVERRDGRLVARSAPDHGRQHAAAHSRQRSATASIARRAPPGAPASAVQEYLRTLDDDIDMDRESPRATNST